jgi:DNA-binding response OmpR family regulator
MKVAILWNTDKTTAFFDGVMETLWFEIEAIDIDDILQKKAKAKHLDIIFLCDVDPAISLEIKDTTQALVYILRSGSVHPNRQTILSLDDTPTKAVTRIQEAVRKKLEQEQALREFSHNGVTLKNGELHYSWGKIELTKRESMILGLFMDPPGKMFNREDIINTLCEPIDMNQRNVDSMIKHIRKKLFPIAGLLDIDTFYGAGYAISISQEQEMTLSTNIRVWEFLFVPDRGKVFVHNVCITSKPFTKTESKILAFLIERIGQKVLREQLNEEIFWEEVKDPDFDTRGIDSHIKRIRHKLGNWKSIIESLYSVWYSLNPENLQSMIMSTQKKTELGE